MFRYIFLILFFCIAFFCISKKSEIFNFVKTMVILQKIESNKQDFKNNIDRIKKEVNELSMPNFKTIF